MDCPFCNDSLQSFIIDRTTIDICSSCSGVWLDAGELQKCIAYLTKRQHLYPPVKTHLSQKPIKIKDLHEPLLLCPRCKKPMEKVNYLYNSNIIIDSCSQCGGVWLDRGEVDKITRFSPSSDVP